jgi:phospholipid/cholesterol/gamma-HCH transport system substrate-binding protein
VRLKIDVERRYQSSVHTNSIFYVTTQGVLGEQFLAIEPGSSDQPVLPEGAVVRALDPPRLDMLVAEMYELLHSTVSSIRENKDDIGKAFTGLTRTLKGTGDFFDKNGNKLDVLADNAVKISEHADELVVGAKGKFVENPQLDRILDNVDKTTGTLAKEGPPLLADAKETIANTKRLTATLGDPAAQAKIKQAVDDVADITSRAKSMTVDAQAVVSHMRKGKGTVGALVMDEQLFDDLQELARDLKHNPWKFLWRE